MVLLSVLLASNVKIGTEFVRVKFFLEICVEVMAISCRFWLGTEILLNHPVLRACTVIISSKSPYELLNVPVHVPTHSKLFCACTAIGAKANAVIIKRNLTLQI